MLEQGAHWGYVIAAYAVTVVVLGALAAFSVLASRRARRELEALEPRRYGEERR